MSNQHGVHLIGSVPLADAATVFRTVAGPSAHGSRASLTARRASAAAGSTSSASCSSATRPWSRTRRSRHSRFASGTDSSSARWRCSASRPAIDPDSVTFETGYAAAARASYAIFRALRDAGAIPPGVRFQVCLPTPMASAYMYVSPGARAAYLPAYERALVQALQDIVVGIPAADLAIQWDVCQEVLVCEGFFPDRPAGVRSPDRRRSWHGLVTPCPMGRDRLSPLLRLTRGRASRHAAPDTAIMVAIANGVRRELARARASTSCTCRFRRIARTPRTSGRSRV